MSKNVLTINCPNDTLVRDFKASAAFYSISTSALLSRLMYLYLINDDGLLNRCYLMSTLEGYAHYGV